MLDRKSKAVLKKLIDIHKKTDEIMVLYRDHKDELQKVYEKSKNPYQNLISSLELLERQNLVTLTRLTVLSPPSVGYISLTKEGINYFSFSRIESFRHWYPHIIATIALIASIAAILISLFYPESLLVKLQLI